MSETCESSMGRKVKTATPHHNSIGTSNWAAFDEHGNAVSEPNFPFEVVIKPHHRTKKLSQEWF